MAVRNYKELSTILKNVTTRLLESQTLCKLLYYTSKDPLNGIDISDTKILLVKPNLIKVIPKVNALDTSNSRIVLTYPRGSRSQENKDIATLALDIFVYTPFSEWIIEGDELRIFLIMSEIDLLLDGKHVDALGSLKSEDFELALTTDDVCGYRMGYSFNVFK